MTYAESIILSACARAKIKTTTELARRCGIPVSTMRHKMAHPGQIRLSDVFEWHRRVRFTNEEIVRLITGLASERGYY